MEPLFLGLGLMFLGLEFGTIVFCFRVYVFWVRVWFGTIVFCFSFFFFKG